MRNKQQQNILIIGVIAAVAAVALITLVVVGTGNRGPAINYSQIPQSRTADGGFLLGDPNAPITVVEFADFMCPVCQEYHDDMQQFIVNHVVTGQAALEYRFLVSSVNPPLGRLAAQVAECAAELSPNSFWEVNDLLYERARAGLLNDQIGREVANVIGVSYTELLSCTSEATQVDTDAQVAQQVGAQGTPSVFYRMGDGQTQPFTAGGQRVTGGVPLNLIAQVVNAANGTASN